VKNLIDYQYRHSKLARRSCKIRWEKHYTTFVKVVEDSEIYNFPIHHFVHFYSRFLSKMWSNTANPTHEMRPALPRARHDTPPRRCPPPHAYRARACAGPPRHLCPAFPEALRARGPLEVLPSSCYVPAVRRARPA
jgi:hypothetical protein